MNIKKPIIAGLMSLATIAQCKAQKPVQFFSEVGVTGVVSKAPVFYGGMNMGITTRKNFTDIYAGINLNTKKQASFTALAFNDYKWTNNVSSWAREVLSASPRGVTSTLEVAPVKGNLKAGKFNFSLAPSYTLYNDFKNGTTKQGINTIFQSTWAITNKDKLFLEGKYMTEPA